MTKRLWGTLCITAMICLAGSSPAWAGRDNVIVALEDDVKTMDFYQTTSRVALYSAYMIWDPLLEREPKTGKIKPHLITSWKIVNNLTWEFKLHPGVKFHNGEPLTAEAVRFTIEDWILNPELKTPVAGGYKWVKKVEVVDDLTFRIHTDKPYPVMLERLAIVFPYAPKWTKEMLAKNGAQYFSTHALGSGPFKFVSYKAAQRIELVRNENYWKKGVPSYPKMTIRIIPELGTRVAELISGGVDVAVNIPPDQLDTINSSPNARGVEEPLLRIFFWQLDGDQRAPGTSPALKDVRVRRAIWHAIDSRSIIKHVLNGHGQYLDIPINPVAFGADTSLKGLEYNPEKAKALLKEAGWEKGFSLTIWNIAGLYKPVNEAAIGYLEKVGIKGVMKDYIGRYGEAAKLCQAGKTDGVWCPAWGSYNIFDADALWPYFFMIPEAPFNYNHDQELSDWLKAARETLDQNKRKELYHKAQKKIMDQAYWIPIFVVNGICGTNKDFHWDYGIDQVPRWQYGTWK
jgi:peptide/nickel transport system substrate-binding protein